MADRLVEMFVESVRLHMHTSRHVVILKEPDRERYLPIWIGSWEASSIAMRLQGHTPERPLTHDLFAAALVDLDVRIRRVVITHLADETYHAQLELDRRGEALELDARPSDALALAVRMDAPIYVAEEVLARAALGTDAVLTAEDDDDAGTATSPLGTLPEDPRLDVFRDFVNSLDQDPGGGSRPSS